MNSSDLSLYNASLTATTTGLSQAVGGIGGPGYDSSNGKDGGSATGSIDLTAPTTALANNQVSATLRAVGGSGGNANGTGNAGNGAGASLVDKTTGVAKTNLALNQYAVGGNGGNANSGTPGTGGNAESALNDSTSVAATLNLLTSSIGGIGGRKTNALGTASVGGNAVSNTTANSSSGAYVDGSALALAGRGGHGTSGANGGTGGNANAVSQVSTNGANRYARATSTAQGGTGGNVDSAGATAGTGGAAYSLASSSYSLGDSQVLASGVATGGNGGSATIGSSGAGGAADANAYGSGDVTTNTFTVTANALGGSGATGGASGNGGAGGNAFASATGSNAGTGFATFEADAVGGFGGLNGGVGYNSGLGGSASATVHGSSFGTAYLTAYAFGGLSPGLLVDGSAVARATGKGPAGSAAARAFSGGGAAVEVSTLANAPLASTSISESRAAAISAFPALALADGLQAAAYAVGMPLSSDVTTAVAGNPHAAQMVGGGADVLGMMLLGGSYSFSGAGTSQTYVSSSTFKIDLTQLSSNQDLQLAVLDATKTGTGFDTLRLEVIREGVSVLDTTYADVTSTLGLMNDFVFNLDDIETGIADNMLDVTVRVNVTTDELGAGFQSYFLLANSPLAPYDGDFNNDHGVDAADYVLWRNGLGTTYTQSDYYVWRSQFGQMVPASGGSLNSSAAVPEPPVAGLLLLALLLTFPAAEKRDP